MCCQKMFQQISNPYLTESFIKQQNPKNKFYNKHSLSSTTIHSVVDIKKTHLSSFCVDFFVFLFEHTLIFFECILFPWRGRVF